MRTKILLSALFSIAIFGSTSCSKEDTTEPQATPPTETYINAISKTTWHYFSFSQNKVVGTGQESATDNAAWAARKDWDMAINRYLIRTNSGAASSSAAQGGVFTSQAATDFNSIATLPTEAAFATDQAVTSEGMTGATTTVKSQATVIVFKTNEDGSSIMPPVYLRAPVYIFRTADGENHYKVQFTQYQDQNKVTGHVKFYSAKI